MFTRLLHGLQSVLKRGGGGMTVNILGKDYKYGQIGSQTWLLENFDHKVGSRYNLDPNVDSNIQYSYCCYYNRNSEEVAGKNGLNYGLIYNPFGIQDVETAIRGSGWHVPTVAEFNQLIDFVGGSSVAGQKLKSSNPDEWGAYAGLDEYGFNVRKVGYLSGGYYSSLSSFNYNSTGFWTSYSSWQKQPYYPFSDDNRVIYTPSGYYNMGFYIRLVKDAS